MGGKLLTRKFSIVSLRSWSHQVQFFYLCKTQLHRAFWVGFPSINKAFHATHNISTFSIQTGDTTKWETLKRCDELVEGLADNDFKDTHAQLLVATIEWYLTLFCLFGWTIFDKNFCTVCRSWIRHKRRSFTLNLTNFLIIFTAMNVYWSLFLLTISTVDWQNARFSLSVELFIRANVARTRLNLFDSYQFRSSTFSSNGKSFWTMLRRSVYWTTMQSSWSSNYAISHIRGTKSNVSMFIFNHMIQLLIKRLFFYIYRYLKQKAHHLLLRTELVFVKFPLLKTHRICTKSLKNCWLSLVPVQWSQENSQLAKW